MCENIVTKVCKTCKETKELSEYFFDKRNNLPLTVCKLCRNKENRDNLREKRLEQGYVYLDPIFKTKKCNVCNIEKIINENNFNKADNKFSHTCKDCTLYQITDYSKPIEKGTSFKTKESKAKQKEYGQKNTHLQRLSAYNRQDKLRGFINDLDSEYIKESLTKSCIYCGFPSTGLDRLDNSKGHTKDNVVPCCKECNSARNHFFSVEETKIIGLAIKSIKIQRELKNQNLN